MKTSKKINLIIGPLLLLLCIVALPDSVFTTFQSRAAIGTVAWMAYWWVTGPVDYAVTAFLPIAVNALLQITDMKDVISNYASETILLLLGASILTVSWQKSGLDKRIASVFLKMLGSNLRQQLVFWFILSALLSSVLPNAVVCATITPIAVSMLTYIGEGDIKNSKVGSKLLLTIAYAAGVGGLASPLGGAMNLVTVDYIQQLTGEEYMYTSWVIRFLPIMIVLVVSNILFMLRDVKKSDNIGDVEGFFKNEYSQLPPMSLEEKASLVCAILSFLITDKEGKRLMVWKSVQTDIIWELIYIFAGGLAAGTLINGSGAAENIGAWVATMNLNGGFVTVLVIITLTLLLSDVTSNTATAAVAMPIVISIIQGIGEDPIPFVYIASIGVNLSYMQPTSIRAIPVGYGMEPKYMFKEGWKLTLIVIALMTILSYALLTYWPAFSTV